MFSYTFWAGSIDGLTVDTIVFADNWAQALVLITIVINKE